MKKTIISLIMAGILLFNIVPISVLAADKNYPESPHNYKNDFTGEWEYKYEENVDRLFVTFSEETYFGPRKEIDEEYPFYELIKRKFCDYLIISTDDDIRTYYEDELAGKTIIIPGNKFSLYFSSNSSGTYYGFKITDISTQGSLGDNVSVTYKIDENNKKTHFYTLNDESAIPILCDMQNQLINDKVIIGWKDDNGHEFRYKNSEESSSGYMSYTEEQYTNVFDLKPGDEVVLTPVTVKVAISADETFSFPNDYDPFYKGYDMTNAHAAQLRKCYQQATWNNQFGIIGLPLGLLLPPIYQKVPWAGSCCGFPIATLMQHYGMIDLRSEQNVSSVSEIEATENIKSAINFYNAVTPAAIVCANKAPESGTEEYKAQIKNLFETVSSGKPAVCFIHCGYIDGVSYKNVFSIMTGILSKGIKYLVNSFADTHCILLTGAYTDGDGNRIFIGYDENEASYCSGTPQIYKVSGDYEDIINLDWFDYGSLGNIAWFNDVSFLESFKADGETDSSAWYSYYCENKDTL